MRETEVRDFNISLECGPKGIGESLLEEMDAFLFRPVTPATLRDMKAVMLRVMHRHGSEIKDDDLLVEFDSAGRRVVVSDARERLRKAIANLESEVMGEDGWWKDPTFAIEQAVSRYPHLQLDVIMDLIETGISIGANQYGG